MPPRKRSPYDRAQLAPRVHVPPVEHVEWVTEIREAAAELLGDPTGAERHVALLLRQAADREDEYQAGLVEPNLPEPGDEAWLALQIARAYLGGS